METLTEEKVAPLAQPLVMTEEEFLEFCDEDTRAEYIDGEVIVHLPVSSEHSRISTFLTTILNCILISINLA